MQDIVIPNKNEKDFVAVAEKIGITSLCFLYNKPTDISVFQKETKIRLSCGILCLPNETQKYRGKYMTFCRAPNDQMQIRGVIENNKPDCLFNLEMHPKKDFMHHRASGLNHVLAVIAKEKKVAIGFNFSEILMAEPVFKAVVLGRMSQNIAFAKKFGFTTIIASFASNPYYMRSQKDLVSLFFILGMDNSAIERSLNWMELK